MSSRKQATPGRRKPALTLLGAGSTVLPASPDNAYLEVFDNSHPDRDYEICFDCPEFTALCPITGQPDFGHITITYVPNQVCVESKSLKLYLGSFRNHGTFHEAVINRIRDDLVTVTSPRRLSVIGQFRPRGGIAIRVTADYTGKSARKR